MLDIYVLLILLRNQEYKIVPILHQCRRLIPNIIELTWQNLWKSIVLKYNPESLIRKLQAFAELRSYYFFKRYERLEVRAIQSLWNIKQVITLKGSRKNCCWKDWLDLNSEDTRHDSKLSVHTDAEKQIYFSLNYFKRILWELNEINH